MTDEEAMRRWEASVTERLCQALKEPYGSSDGQGIRYYTLDEIIARVRSRSDAWRTLLGRIEEVDPEWLDAWRHRAAGPGTGTGEI